MKKVIGMMVGALVCSLAVTASAVESLPEAILRVGADENLGFVYAKDGAWDGTTCTHNTILYIDTSTQNGRLMYQTALAAYLAGKVIVASYTDCIGTHPKAARIDIVGP